MTAAAAQERNFVAQLTERRDFAIISELVEPGSKVLDLGCGDGELLAWLAEHKKVVARGVEISPARVQKCIAQGLSVYQGDIDTGLADYPDQCFDFVILSQTLQETHRPLEVLHEMLRVGRRVIVAFPNFGHWTMRLSLLMNGRAPKTKLFPYEWYNSPNIHFLSVQDFEDLAAAEGLVVERRIFLSGKRMVRALPNLRAQVAVYLVRRV
jgi:methionine biosynthesis protein MetW